MQKSIQSEELLEEWDWDQARPSGKAVSRSEAHRLGIPHEGVHLWVINTSMEDPLVLFQRRAAVKESYPDCLDITVGGHVPFGRNKDKIQKESMEEIGIAPREEDLVDLGYFRYEEWDKGLIHREFQRVYLYVDSRALNEFRFVDGEVDGIYAVKLDDLETLLTGQTEFTAEGFDGRGIITRRFSNRDFHPLLFSPSMEEYMKVVIAAIKQIAVKEEVSVSMPPL